MFVLLVTAAAAGNGADTCATGSGVAAAVDSLWLFFFSLLVFIFIGVVCALDLSLCFTPLFLF